MPSFLDSIPSVASDASFAGPDTTTTAIAEVSGSVDASANDGAVDASATQADIVPDPDASAALTAPAPKEGEEGSVEVNTASDEAARDAAEAAAAASAEVPVVEPVVLTPELEAAATALREAARALGITETDLTKIPALITERNQQAEQVAETERAAAAETEIVTRATESILHMVDEQVVALLAAEGYSTEGEWWTGEGGAAMLARFGELKNGVLQQSQWETAYQNAVAKGQADYQAEQTKVAEITEKYPHHSVKLVANLRKFGATPDFLEQVAQETHTSVERAIATQNSVIVARDAEIDTLRAQVSGHAETLAKAKADGISEGRLAALEEIEKGRSLPNTVGLGAPTPDNRPSVKSSGFRLDAIPTAN